MRVCVFLILTVALVAGSLSAQQMTGRIIGKVVDNQGEALPGVSIEASGTRLVGRAAAITDTQGVYRLVALPPGSYTVIYSLSGFQSTTRKDIIVQVEGTVTLDIAMALGKINEEITVIGKSPMIDVKSTTRGATLNRQVFSSLPKGRNFDSLLVTVPGVSQEGLLAGTSVDGASGAENMYYVDGINTNNLTNGVSAQQVNFDFVEEVSFKSSGYNAEFGGSMGGVVNVLTRSGGNAYHGEIIGNYLDEALTARRRDVLNLNYKSTTNSFSYYSFPDFVGVDTLHNIEAGFNLGGYLIKDKIWFFASFMPQYQYLNRSMNFALQSNPALTRDITQKLTWLNGQAKLSAQPFSNLRISASVINNMLKQRGQLANAWNASSTTDYSAIGFDFPNFSASVTADLIVSNNFLVGLRGGYFSTNQNNQQVRPTTSPIYVFQMEQPYSYDATTNDIAAWPEIPAYLRHGSSWQNTPGSMQFDTKKVLREKYSAGLDLTYFFNLGGEHSLKVGGQFIRQGEDVDNSAVVPIIYLAWNQTLNAYGTNYGRGAYGWYAVRGNDRTGSYGNLYNAFSNQWAFYLQDSWTIANRLTINAGLRTESEYIPNYSSDPIYAGITKPVNFGFADKLSPRLGFIYDVFGDSSLKVFGSFAIYQDVMKLNMAANALGGFKWKSAYYTLDTYNFDQIGVNGNYPGTFLAMFDHRAPVFDTIDPDMKPFTQREISFGLDKRLSENLSFSLRVVNKNVLWAIEDCGVYVPGIGEVYYYCNPGGDFINEKYRAAEAAGLMAEGTPPGPKAKRLFWAVNVGIDKRLSDNWLFGASYTWSRLTGNYSGLANADEGGRNSPNGERAFDLWHMSYDLAGNPIDGVLPTDRPHYFKLYSSYVFPWGLSIGTVMHAQSGTPLTTFWNIDTPNFIPYNRGDLGRTPFVFFADSHIQYDLRLGRYRVQFSANITNMFNIDTWTGMYTQYNRGNYSPGEEALVEGGWSIPSTVSLDPRYKKPNAFFAPLQTRLGVKVIF
jgi:hypothetical protein